MFQWLMNIVLRDHHDYTTAYLDDVIMYSSTREDHCYHLNNSIPEPLCHFGLDSLATCLWDTVGPQSDDDPWHHVDVVLYNSHSCWRSHP